MAGLARASSNSFGRSKLPTWSARYLNDILFGVAPEPAAVARRVLSRRSKRRRLLNLTKLQFRFELLFFLDPGPEQLLEEPFLHQSRHDAVIDHFPVVIAL